MGAALAIAIEPTEFAQGEVEAALRALVAFESIYGDTREIANAIAEGLGNDTNVTELDPPARSAKGVRSWLAHLPSGGAAAAFDTRIDKSGRTLR